MNVLFLAKEYFRIQRNLFNSLKPKILPLQKRNSNGKSLQNVFIVRGKRREELERKGGQKVWKNVLNFERRPLFIKVGMLKEISKKRMGKILKKKEKRKEKKILIRVSWFFRLEPVSVFWSYLFTQNSD